MTDAVNILNSVGGRERVTHVAAAARNAFCAQILGESVAGLDQASKAEREEWTRLLEITEYVALSICGETGVERLEPDELALLKEMCSHAFEFHRVLHEKRESPASLKQALTVACLAVLSNRVDDWRRWIKSPEIGWPVSSTEVASTDWAARLFRDTTDAFLRLVRKDGWADLRAVAHFVTALRADQATYEMQYLDAHNGVRQTAALEIVTFYHLAKAVEVAAEFSGHGKPNDARADVALHLRQAIDAADVGGVVEWAVLLRWVRAGLQRLIETTLWHQLAAYNHRVTEFKHALTRDEAGWRPLFELLPPQQDAIHQVMSLALRSVVVQMPTSSGKTLLAQFRIIQAKTNYPQGWIAYLVPTRALVNQIVSRLRRSFSPMGIRVEVASPAEELDVFEEQLFEGDQFDVLVTTPEKLDLIIRGERINLEKRPLSLVICDEAHHIGDKSRGLRAELLLTNINQISRKDTAFLLLTPFIENAKEVARWLEPDAKRSDAVRPVLSLDWRPNDLLVATSTKVGKGKSWTISMSSLHTSRSTIDLGSDILLEPLQQREETISASRSLGAIAADTARQLGNRGTTLTMVLSPAETWKVAERLKGTSKPATNSDRRTLVRKFLEEEYGASYPLCTLLDYRIAVHHGGLSEDSRLLVEWLMEKDELDQLVATSTLAQGVNFGLTNLVLASLSVKMGDYTRPMTYDEFWNASGRAGRLDQDMLGVVAIACNTEEGLQKATNFVEGMVGELVSSIEALIADVERLGWELDLSRLGRNDPKWSAFVQYLSHCYRQLGSAEKFAAETEKILSRTYAYIRLEKKKPAAAKNLLAAVRAYGAKLSSYPKGVLTLVDSTGFSPESIIQLMAAKETYLPRTWSEWSPSQLFRTDGGISAIIGRLLTVREADLTSPSGQDHRILSSLINGWVNGKSLGVLARLVPRRQGESEEAHLTMVSRLIARNVSRTTSWGLSAVQSMADIDPTQLSAEEIKLFKSLPAMVYYGCKTVDGVLMRSQGVARSICEELGAAYRKQVPSNENELSSARQWLAERPSSDWDRVARSKSKLSGAEHRSLWRVVNGLTE